MNDDKPKKKLNNVSTKTPSDSVPRLPFCCNESVKLDYSVGIAKLKEMNNKGA